MACSGPKCLSNALLTTAVTRACREAIYSGERAGMMVAEDMTNGEWNGEWPTERITVVVVQRPRGYE